jgi:hypothetical protein
MPTLLSVKILSDHHQHGETICRVDFPEEEASLRRVLNSLSPSMYEIRDFTENTRPKRPKRQEREIGGVRLPFLMPVDQRGMNKVIKAALEAELWSPEPVAAGPMAAPDTPLALRGDFVRNRVFVEVEFGNVASMHRDFFKFQIANRSGAGDVGVLVVATERLARFFDSNVATYETAQRNKPYLAIGVQMPVWIVGIEPDDGFAEIGTQYEAMRALCTANGVDCHSFDTAIGAPKVIAIDGT